MYGRSSYAYNIVPVQQKNTKSLARKMWPRPGSALLPYPAALEEMRPGDRKNFLPAPQSRIRTSR